MTASSTRLLAAIGQRHGAVLDGHEWSKALDFSFPLDFPAGESRKVQHATVDRTVSVTIPTWLQHEVGGTLDVNAHAAVASFLLFELLLKCRGDTATLIIDGKPPLAMASPLAADRSKKVSMAITELRSALKRPTSSAAATGGLSLAQKIEHELKQPRRSALVGTIALLTDATVQEIGETTLLVAFDVYVAMKKKTTGIPAATEAPPLPNSSSSTATTTAAFEMTLHYNATMFSEESASVWVEVIQHLSEQLEGSHNVAVGALEATTPRMIEQMNVQWQPKPISFDDALIDRLMPDMFEESVKSRCDGHPETQIAMIDPKVGRTVTYQQMSETTTKLAAWLREKLPQASWGTTAVIGIYIPRQIDFYFSAFGVMKAGSAYLPLDPDFPPDRLAFALQDSRSCALLTTSSLVGSLDFKGPTFVVDALWEEINAMDLRLAMEAITPCPATSTSAAYLTYTSGSTGKPKGVLVEHRSIVNFIVSERCMYNLDNKHRILQAASVAFDASQEEVWWAFGSGSALVLIDKQTVADPELFARFIIDQRITGISNVPSLIATVPPSTFNGLRIMVVGGEACNQDLCNALGGHAHFPLMNSYGPTETTVACMWQRLRAGKQVTIGQATPGNFVAVIDEQGAICPPGVPGELVVAGPGLARGYVNLDTMTAKKFVHCPFLSNPPLGFDRMYHTGDLVRWRPDCGEVEFLGRIDCQVKLRGYRIELGEIESTVTQYPGVEAAVATLRDKDGDQPPYLCCYIVPKPELKSSFQERDVRKFLSKVLPSYMVPDRVCLIAAIPRSSTDKIDRRQLRPPQAIGFAGLTASTGPVPHGPMEQLVFNAWCEVLKGRTITTNMNFFEIGGQSLLAGQLSTHIRRLGFPDFVMRDVYSHPTIQQQAAWLKTMEQRGGGKDRAEPPSTEGPPTLAETFVPSYLRMIVFGIWQMFIFSLVVFVTSANAALVTALGLWWYAPRLLIVASSAGSTTHILGQALSWGMWIALVLNFAQMFLFIVWVWVMAPLLKWLLLGRVGSGRYSIWSFYFLRWWTARALTSISLTTPFVLPGTPMLSLWLRCFGAHVGSGVTFCGTLRPVDADLMNIGDDVFVAEHTMIAPSEVVDGELWLLPVTIGNGSSLWNRCVVSGGSVVPPNCVVMYMGSVAPEDTVPDGSVWSGSPGRKIGTAPVEVAPSVFSESEAHDLLPMTILTSSTGQNQAGGYGTSSTDRAAVAAAQVPLIDSTDSNRFVSAARLSPKAAILSTVVHFLTTSVAYLAGTYPFTLAYVLVGWSLYVSISAPATISPDFMYIIMAILAAGSPVVVAVGLIGTMTVLWIIRMILFPRNIWRNVDKGDIVRATVGDWLMIRILAFHSVHKLAMMFFYPVFGTIFASTYYRLMGWSVGSRSEIVNVYSWIPGQVSIGEGCFLADMVCVCPLEMHRGHVVLRRLELGDRVFVGNHAVIAPGLQIGTGTLIGLMSCVALEAGCSPVVGGNFHEYTSLTPKNSNSKLKVSAGSHSFPTAPTFSQVLAPGATYLGNPAFVVQRPARDDGELDHQTYHPTVGLQLERFCWETVKIVGPGVAALDVFFIAIALLKTILPTTGWNWNLHGLLLAFWSISMISYVLQTILGTVLKWVLVGRYQPHHLSSADGHAPLPMYHSMVWRSELVTDFMNSTFLYSSFSALKGSVWISWLLRLQGAHIGARCYIDSVQMPEPDLVTIGDECCLNEWCLMQTHLFEDRMMNSERVRVEDRVSIGYYSTLMHLSVTGAGSTVASNSLVMKGESYGTLSHLRGIPVTRRQGLGDIGAAGRSPDVVVSVDGSRRSVSVPLERSTGGRNSATPLTGVSPDPDVELPVDRVIVWLRRASTTAAASPTPPVS